MFQNADQKLGSVKEGTKKMVSYPFHNVHAIDEVKTSCVCSVGDIDRVHNVLKIEYKAKDIPQHLIAQGWYSSLIKTTVKYRTISEPEVQKTQILTFSVTVVK